MQLCAVNIVGAAGDAITRFALQLPTPKLMQLCLLASRGAAETAELLRAVPARERTAAAMTAETRGGGGDGGSSGAREKASASASATKTRDGD